MNNTNKKIKPQPKINPAEIEIFRITPMPEKLYETACYTRRTGVFPNEKYFTTNIPRFVGKFIKHYQIGYGDGAIHYDIFEKDGHKERVDYSYDGTTCYREYDPLNQPCILTKNTPISEQAFFDLQQCSVPKTPCCLIT